MQLLPIESIQVLQNERQRKEFPPDYLQQLKSSIETPPGLLQPIVIRRSAQDVVLVAGECRLRAIKEIFELGGSYEFEGVEVPCGQIPTTDLGELSEYASLKAEFDENDKRLNISWQEKAAATSRIERLRSIEAVSTDAPIPTVADVAQERRGSREGAALATTRKELVVARYFNDAEVAGARTLDDAFTVLKRREETQRRVEEAKRIGATFSSAEHTLINDDVRNWISAYDKDTFDVILTDPPYGMGADEFGDAGGNSRAHEYDDNADVLKQLLTFGIAEHLYRIAKSRAHLYWFCDPDWFPELRDRFADAGWRVHRTHLIWHKPNAFRAPWPQMGPRRNWEAILYAVKGDRQTTMLGSDVITAPLEPRAEGAQKPVELFAELLRRSIEPGNTVLDCFCGSGPIFPAAHALKCRATGIELRASEYVKAAKRLKELK